MGLISDILYLVFEHLKVARKKSQIPSLAFLGRAGKDLFLKSYKATPFRQYWARWTNVLNILKLARIQP